MRVLTLIALCVALLGTAAQAQDFTAVWIKQLRIDGYEDIEIERTWLGRTRIIAEKGEIEREIILNGKTGEVLRDYSRAEDGAFRLPLGWVVDFDDDHDEDDDHEVKDD